MGNTRGSTYPLHVIIDLRKGRAARAFREYWAWIGRHRPNWRLGFDTCPAAYRLDIGDVRYTGNNDIHRLYRLSSSGAAHFGSNDTSHRVS